MKLTDTGRRFSLKALFAIIFYLIVPIIIVNIIINTYPELGGERYATLIYLLVPIAVLLVVLSQLSIMYPKGDKRRFAYNIAYILTAMIWLFGFLGGGLVITDYWGEYQFSLHLWKYVALIVAVGLFNVFYYILEWRVYGEDLRNRA